MWSVLNGPPHPLQPEWTLPGAFTALLATHPALLSRPALLTDTGAVSYQVLSVRAHALARALRARLRDTSPAGVQATPLVGVCLSRSPALVEVLLAVLQAGGAYLPLEPGLPPERLAHLVADAAPSLVVTTPEHAALARRLVPAHTLWVLDTNAPLEPGEDTSAPPPGASERPFAVLYTSGSTGQPHGVRLPHRAAHNRLQWMTRAFPFTEGEVACWKTPLGFVDSIWELFGALLQGVAVAVAPDGLEKRPGPLLAFAARHGVSRLIVVPSLLRVLLPHLTPARPAPAPRLWTCSGEPLPPALVEAFLARRPDDVLLNLYGSTEVMGDVTAHVCRAGEDPLPIGLPIDNTTIELLDDTGTPVPVGERGALHVRGANLALGLPGADPARYDTGDLARLVRASPTGDWTLVHEGRRDRQVKLFGNRFDLAELEHVLQRCAGVQAAVALADVDAHGPLLYGFVQPRAPGAVTPEALRAACDAALPPHARPVLHLVEDWPALPNGKLDRSRLLTRGKALATPGEDSLTEAWRAVLPQAPCEDTTDFFQAGGTSLLAVELLRRLDAHGTPVPLERFYAAPTLGALRRGCGQAPPPDGLTLRVLDSARDARGTACLALLADRFAEVDPLARAIGATREDLHVMFTSFLEACAPDGLSFEALDGHGTRVGCVVAGDWFGMHAHGRAGRLVIPPALEALDAALSAVSDPWSHRLGEPAPGAWVYGLLLAATGTREVARITHTLEAHVLHEARARGCQGLVTVNTHALTQRVCEELGYRPEERLDTRAFVHRGTRPFAAVPEDGAELRLHVLRL
ncbi:non-ribosomal peptide synthetase [Melittangium boletus]|uniref:non-ribosomal peptide synthetase n=1 Tax=Melittangium boletus TaxID=83453 RepID=UPI003DA4823C